MSDRNLAADEASGASKHTMPVEKGPKPGPGGDPLGRWCPKHDMAYVDCGYYSVCPECYKGAK